MLPDLLLAIVLLQTAAKAAPQVSPVWQRAADLLHSAMNESADPCDDFYEFACGNWPKLNPIPPNQSYHDAGVKLEHKLLSNLTKLFHDFDPQKHPEAVKKAKIYYDACTGKTKRGEDLKYIVKRLNEYGKWPLISQDWSGPVGGPWKNASALNGRLAGTIEDGLISIYPLRGLENHPEQPYLRLIPTATSYYPPATEKIFKEVSALARKLANASGMVLDQQILHEDAMDTAAFEVKLYKLVHGRVKKRIFNVSSATARWPFFDWRAMLSAAAMDNIPREAMLTVPLSVKAPTGLDKLGPIIKATPDRLMQNFLLWRFARNEMYFIPSHSSKQNMDTIHRRTKIITDDKDILCTQEVIEAMPWATGRLYVDQWIEHHASNTRSTLRDMLGFVLTAFKGNVHELDWMDEQSKMGAYRKLDNMVRNVAYNDWMIEDAALNQHYAALNISMHDDMFKVKEQLSRLSVWRDFQKLVNQRDRTDMGRSPADVNAWYSKWCNSITFPAAIINEPFFLPNGPMTVNFGAIGSIMGHELTHAFDSNNIKFGPFGVKNETHWMTNKSMEGFNKMAKCIVDQYDHFCFKRIGKCINGRLTETENTADNGGLFAAYNGYQSWTSLSGGEPRLPEPMSKYSQDQIFFLSFARGWCGNITDQGLKQELRFDKHSPNHARVTQTLRNMPQFAKAFNCKAGSGMAPRHRCYVWVKPQE